MLGRRQERWVRRRARRLPRPLEHRRPAAVARRARASARTRTSATGTTPGTAIRWRASACSTPSSTNDVRNPVFFTGDWHSTFVNDLKLDFKDPAAPTVATEFVTPAITTGGDDTPYGPYYAPMVPVQPAHQVLRGRPPRLHEGDGDEEAAASRPALRDQRRGLRLAPATPSARSTSRTATRAPSSDPGRHHRRLPTRLRPLIDSDRRCARVVERHGIDRRLR